MGLPGPKGLSRVRCLALPNSISLVPGSFLSTFLSRWRSVGVCTTACPCIACTFCTFMTPGFTSWPWRTSVQVPTRAWDFPPEWHQNPRYPNSPQQNFYLLQTEKAQRSCSHCPSLGTVSLYSQVRLCFLGCREFSGNALAEVDGIAIWGDVGCADQDPILSTADFSLQIHTEVATTSLQLLRL